MDEQKNIPGVSSSGDVSPNQPPSPSVKTATPNKNAVKEAPPPPIFTQGRPDGASMPLYSPTAPRPPEQKAAVDPSVSEFEKEGILLKKEPAITPVRDPFLASRVLAEERAAPKTLKHEPPSPLSSKEKSAGGTGKKETIKRLRTLQGDIAEALKKQKTSVIQMVIAEHAKKQQAKQDRSPVSKRNLPLIIFSLVLGGLGIALVVAGVFYAKNSGGGNGKTAVTVPAIVFAETKKEIDATNITKEILEEKMGQELAADDMRIDTIKQLYFTREVPDAGEGAKVVEGSSAFFKHIETTMPVSLQRSFGEPFMLGIHAFNGNQPFLIFTTQFFENAFAGMLSWEPLMSDDLLPLFHSAEREDVAGKNFEDVVVRNRDIRALKNQVGDIVLLYSFFNRNTLVITTSLDTLDEIFSRLNKTGQALQ